MKDKAEGCKTEEALEVIMGKWKLTILFYLIFHGTQRFSELRNLMPEVTQKMLTNQLRELEEQDIIRRVVYAQVPPKVEYSITEHGRTLQSVLGIMNEWGAVHAEHMQSKKPNPPLSAVKR
ncbi:winged helix-turn-helix transcriptional regulator [Cohnella sp.]|uniref:winged helix-turn-helix transcriptional regulator n=1 Tax=Cohnella sp. TaxID=1883426 RepID=UPI003567C1AC